MIRTNADQSPTADVRRLEFALEVGSISWWEMDCASGAVRFHMRKTDALGHDAAAFTRYSHFTALLHPDDLEPAMQAMRDLLSGALPEYRITYRIATKAGAYRWFEDVGRISARDEAGHPVTVTGVAIDVTERRIVEAALAASEERFRRLFHGHSAVKLVIDLATGDIVDANDAAADFYGWSVADLKQMRIQQINALPPDAVKQRVADAAATASARFEFQHRRADGSVRDVEVYSNCIDIAGRACLYSIIHDISDRKLAERALKVSEQRFRTLAENMTDALWVLDDQTERYVYVSPSIEKITGYTAAEVMGGTARESLSPESYAAMRRVREARLLELERGESRSYVDVVEQTHRNGSRVTVEVHGRLVRNAETGRVEAVGVARDITGRVRIERALRAVHDRLRRAEDFARFGHWEFSLDERIMRASEGATTVYGFEHRELHLSEVQDCALPEYRPRLDRALADLIERHEPYDQEFKIRRASDGEIVHVHSRAEYDPLTQKVFGVVQDISERKRIEEDRERLIRDLRAALEHVKTLRGIVPICASCKKIRDDRGFWEQVEAYVARHTDARFSHSICPDCMAQLYPDD